ncbi:hypothetical protein [Janthinobacterium aquaticum]|uniref:hypothetical protein n=1 Tax=Janthinobacterium sp. FT58W TaxID=2654254 RepID=UPI0012657EFF|nr:hypothetical protein [Janthinobacterium sp. FT58W]KAB8042841.1 hypothetical protein GCM43_12370 [Janthinobacterium sp. FT58W]
MYPIEQKLWFVAIICFFTSFLNIFLIRAAGLQLYPLDNIAAFVLMMLSWAAIYRSLSFAGWLLVLWMAPHLADKRIAKRS